MLSCRIDIAIFSKYCISVFKTKSPRIETEGITIADAYDQLPRITFAVWIRLAVVPQHELETLGIHKLATKLGYSWMPFYNQVQVLRNSGYLRYVYRGSKTAQIYLVKRPMLIGVDQFIKLS